MAREEIEKIKADPANHPETISRQLKEIEILEIFLEGFEQIAKILSVYATQSKDLFFLKKVEGVVSGVGKQVDAWLGKNAPEVTDWVIRLPVFVAGVAALGWAGADMTVGTTAVAALVGGGKVLDVITTMKKAK